jgi:hypothetical protein
MNQLFGHTVFELFGERCITSTSFAIPEMQISDDFPCLKTRDFYGLVPMLYHAFCHCMGSHSHREGVPHCSASLDGVEYPLRSVSCTLIVQNVIVLV